MKYFKLVTITLGTIFIFSSLANAQKLPPDGPTITDVWIRPTNAGSDVSAAYMHIKSATALRLIRVESPLVGIAELHSMNMNDGVMEMRAEDAFVVPAGNAITLKPGSMHIMLMKVKQPIKSGDKVPLTLTFEAPDKMPLIVKLDATARAGGTSDAKPHHAH